MNVKNVSFSGGLNIDESVSKKVAAAVKESSAMKYFEKFYSADVFETRMFSEHNKDVIYLGLSFENIKPKNKFVALYDFIKGRRNRSYNGSFDFNSGRRSEDGLINYLKKIDKKYFIKKFREAVR